MHSDKMDKRNKEFDEQVKSWEKREEEAQRRIKHSLEYKYYTQDSYVYHYESGPMDFYEGWKPLHTCSYNIHHEFMKGLRCAFESSLEKQILSMERLLLMSLLHYGDKLIGDLRGEMMHYAYVCLEDEHFSSSQTKLVICIKHDNNGTMSAFSHSPFLAKNIPHDNGSDWKLIDAQLTEFKTTNGERNV